MNDNNRDGSMSEKDPMSDPVFRTEVWKLATFWSMQEGADEVSQTLQRCADLLFRSINAVHVGEPFDHPDLREWDRMTAGQRQEWRNRAQRNAGADVDSMVKGALEKRAALRRACSPESCECGTDREGLRNE